MNRICKIIWSLVQNGYVVVFELAKGRGKVAAQKLVRILTAAVLGMILGGAALPAYVATPTMLVTSDLTHPIAGPCLAQMGSLSKLREMAMQKRRPPLSSWEASTASS